MDSFVRSGVRQAFWLAAALSGTLWIAVPNSARAEVTVTGTSKEATIQASDATLEELLSALHDKLNLTYTSSAPLDHKVMDGTFVGPLTKILTPLLKGYDHVMKVQDGRISVVLTDQKKSRVKASPVAPAAAPTAPETSAAASGADKPAKNELVADSKKQDEVAPNGVTPGTAPSTSPHPSPFAVTTFLETQMTPFINQASAAAKAAPLPAGAVPDAFQQYQQQQQASQLASQQASQQASQFADQQAAIAQTMQRANVALQSLVGALKRLPQ